MRSRALPPEPAYDERPRRGLSLSSLGAPGRRFDARLNVPEADSRLQSDAVLASLPADPAREVRASVEAHHRFATARAVARSTPGRRDTDSPEADLSGGRAVDARRSAGPASRIADGFDAVAIRVATACAAPVASRRRRRGHPLAEVPPLELVPLGAAPLPELLPVAEPLEVHGALPLDPVAICPSTQTPVPPVPVAGGAPSVR